MTEEKKTKLELVTGVLIKYFTDFRFVSDFESMHPLDKTESLKKISKEILKEAKQIAEEWVTAMRLTHVLDKLDIEMDMKNVKEVIMAMREDIKIESVGEVEWSREVDVAIGKSTVRLFKIRISKI